jgi:hypothetical protein
MKLARRWTLIMLALAAVIFLIGGGTAAAGLYWEPALALGVVGISLSLLIAFFSLIPLFIAWNFNRKSGP